MNIRIRSVALALAAAVSVTCSASTVSQEKSLLEQALELHRQSPLIDGHNDLPWQYRLKAGGDVSKIDLREHQVLLHTDIPRLRKGMVGGQFWSVHVPVTVQGQDPVRAAMEQVDVVYQMLARYSDVFELATSASDVERAFKAGKIASLMGMEGGHSIDNSLGVLRMFYKLGVRYMTLTHSTNTRWADSSTDKPEHGGLTGFGEAVVREMNWLGMLVDLSHVSADTMRDTLRVTEAPVIFSHSAARGLTDHPRNVPDDVLASLPGNGGLVMVTFVPEYISPGPRASMADVVNHIDHIRRIAGIDHIGLGSDFDGITSTPQNLEDVSTYPLLTAELLRRGYTTDDVKNILGLNILRVMREAEAVSARLQKTRGPSAVGYR